MKDGDSTNKISGSAQKKTDFSSKDWDSAASHNGHWSNATAERTQ